MQNNHESLKDAESTEVAFLEVASFLADRFGVKKNFREALATGSINFDAIQKTNNPYALLPSSGTTLRRDLFLAQTIVPECLNTMDSIPGVTFFLETLTQHVTTHASQFQQLSEILTDTKHAGQSLVTELSEKIGNVQQQIQQIARIFQEENKDALPTLKRRLL